MKWQGWVMTMGGVGRLPHAPGTWASLVTVLLVGGVYAGVSHGIGPIAPNAWNLMLVGGILLFSTLAVLTGSGAVTHFEKKDPGPFVLDEAAGVCVTFLFLPIEPNVRGMLTCMFAFLGFRLFDILKPPPCHALEKLPAGWGILADDLMAGVYANVACQVVLRTLFYK